MLYHSPDGDPASGDLSKLTGHPAVHIVAAYALGHAAMAERRASVAIESGDDRDRFATNIRLIPAFRSSG
jgi:hypothetical protein